MMEGVVGWPAEVAARYAAAGYWRGVPIGDVFDQSVRRHARHQAVIDGQRRTSYQ